MLASCGDKLRGSQMFEHEPPLGSGLDEHVPKLGTPQTGLAFFCFANAFRQRRGAMVSFLVVLLEK